MSARALALSDQAGGLFWIEIEAGTLLPVLDALEGDEEAAEAGLARLSRAIARPEVARSMRSWVGVYLFVQARIRWLQGRVDEALPTLIDAMGSDNEWVRLRAINALDRLDGRAAPAESALREALEDPNDYVVRVAEHAVEAFGGR